MNIYETAVYCGGMKEWRVLNLLTGTIYSVIYPDYAAAMDSIEDGTVRDGYAVRRVTLREINDALRLAGHN